MKRLQITIIADLKTDYPPINISVGIPEELALLIKNCPVIAANIEVHDDLSIVVPPLPQLGSFGLIGG